MVLGFTEARAREAVDNVGDKSDAQLAMNWLFDNGEEDKGGAVVFKNCPHVDELGSACLVTCGQLEFGQPCIQNCGGRENWVCLMCGETRCGRYSRRHAVSHWEQTKRHGEAQLSVAQVASGAQSRGHCLALSLGDLSVWCYECDSYVKHETLTPLVKKMERLKFGEDEKQQGCSAELPLGSQIPAEPVAAHGCLGEVAWPLPKLARACGKEARPGYRTMPAHEYLDEPEVLRAKVCVLADLIRRSSRCVAYTGAGISTSSGISDYATKASDSVAARGRQATPWEAQPTLAHRVLVALHRAGHLKHWVQQNHDGLPQKAGFPQRDLNEIHGAWYDPSNPVVPMSGNLRADLIDDMYKWEARVDLCLALGTSMVGMNADRLAVAPAERMRKGAPGALGTVIVALQQTQYDTLASLRIFATIDSVAELLAQELALSVAPAPALRAGGRPAVLEGLPYGPDGRRAPGESLRLDLRPGSRLRVVNQPDWDQETHGNVCEVVEAPDEIAREGHVSVRFGRAGSSNSVRRVLGSWWLEAAQAGAVEVLPVVPHEG